MSYKIWTLVIEKGDITVEGPARPLLTPESEAELARSDMAMRFVDGKPVILKQPKERINGTSAVATQRFSELETDKPVAAPKPMPAPIVEAKPAKPVEVKPTVKDTSPEASWQRYEYIGGSSKKFWEIRLDGDKYVTRWGRIGTDGSVTVKDCGHPYKARSEYHKIIDSKLNKGYKRVK